MTEFHRAVATLVCVSAIVLGIVSTRSRPSVPVPTVPVPTKPVPTTRISTEPFEEKWRQVPNPVPARVIPLSQDSVQVQLPSPPLPSPRPSQVKVTTVQVPPVKPEKTEDVCTRHKMAKVITKGGKSWRCRRK